MIDEDVSCSKKQAAEYSPGCEENLRKEGVGRMEGMEGGEGTNERMSE